MSRYTGQTRIDPRWSRELPAIAEMFVACGEVRERTCARLNARYGLPRHRPGERAMGVFKPGKLKNWLKTSEFQAHVQEAKRRLAEQGADAPETRSVRFREWIKRTAERYRTEYEAAEKVIADADPGTEPAIKATARLSGLEGRLLNLRKAEREEERHSEDLARRVALRSMKTFAENLLALVREIEDPAAMRRALADAIKRPAKLLDGIE